MWELDMLTKTVFNLEFKKWGFGDLESLIL